MSTNLTKRSTFLFINNILENLLKILSGFVVTPIIIKGLSKELYGAWAMILQLLNYIALTNLRSSTTLKITLTATQYNEDFDYKRRQVGAAVRMWLYTLPLTFFVSVIIILISNHIFKTEAKYDSTIKLALVVSVIAFATDQFLSISGNLMRGSNMDYKGIGIRSIAIIIGGGLNILAIKLNLSIIGLSISNLISVLFTGFVWYHLAKKYIPWYGIGKPTKKELAIYRTNTFHIFLSSIGSLLVLSSDAFLLGIFVNTKVVAIFVTTSSLLRIFIVPISNIVSSANAGLAGLCGLGQWERVLSIRKELLNIVMFVFLLFAVNVLLTNEPFLKIWVGDGYYGGDWVNFLFVVGYFLFVIQMVDVIILDGLQQYKIRSRTYLIGASIVLVLSLLFVPKSGMVGMAAISMIAKLFSLLSFRYFISKKIDVKFSVLFSELFRPILVATVIFFAFSMIDWDAQNWLQLIRNGMIITIIAGTLLFFAGFNGEARKLMLLRLKTSQKIILKKFQK
jgi:O-antigen/teichoic acid export membrane protein